MATITASDLAVEYLHHPIGLGEVRPRLSWVPADGRAGARQSAYRVRVASAPEKLNDADVWDSGVVGSSTCAHVVCGTALHSRQRLWWDVQLWDADGVAGPPSTRAYFEIGLLQRDDWSGQFVGTPIRGAGWTMAASPLLRRGFSLPAEVTSARLYITSLGLYEASINGRRVGDDWLRPGWTDYDHELSVQTYDVTHLLKPGENAIGAMLGDGWWSGRLSHYDRGMRWGQAPALLAQLEMTCADGSCHVVATDAEWQWVAGPILGADLFQGEEYNARRELPGWDTATPPDADWRNVTVEPWPKAAVRPAVAPPVRVVRELEPLADPVKVDTDWNRHTQIFDLGQNFAGTIRLKVRGPKGCTIRMRYAEVLRPDGKMDTSNLRSARCTDLYTLRGDPAGETYSPRFTFHGFRYVELAAHRMWLEASPSRPALELFTRETVRGLVLMNELETTGEFHTDHALLNRLQENIVWGQRSNFLEVPTDCPQRDERLGWTGDAQIFAPTAAFNMNVASFFTKWMQDMDQAQLAPGQVPAVVPNMMERDDGGPGWSDARVLVPWAMYWAYGDRHMLERHYQPMRRWMDWIASTARDGQRCYDQCGHFVGFGDWLALDGEGLDAFKSGTPKSLVGTAYYARSLGVMRQIATVLGQSADAERYATLRTQAEQALQREFFTPAGVCKTPTQTAYCMALAWDLLPEAARPTAVAELVRLIAERDNHLSTGFLGTPLLCPTLTRFGHLDLAYALLFQESYPGWLYPVTLGATTMWERWNSWHPDQGFVEVGMNSLNHYAYGAIGEWMYSCVAGIAPAEPGYTRVRIAPRPGGPLKHVRARLRTLRGDVAVEWTRSAGGAVRLRVTVPVSTTADLVRPDGHTEEIAAGAHEREWS